MEARRGHDSNYDATELDTAGLLMEAGWDGGRASGAEPEAFLLEGVGRGRTKLTADSPQLG